MTGPLFGVLWALCPCGAEASDLQVLPEKVNEIAPAEMMHAYLLGRAHEATERRDREYENLKTAEQLAEYQRRMRQFFTEQLGGFPERTPLNAKVVGSDERDGYRIEKVIFESQPRHYVTAILYLPDAEPPYPGVLEPHLFSSGRFEDCLHSWANVVRTPLATNQLDNVVHRALTKYDLPDLVGTMPADKFSVVNPLDATEKPLSPGK